MDVKAMVETIRDRAAAALAAAGKRLEALDPRRRLALAAGAGAVAVLGFLLYVSPYAALRGFQAALADRDAEAIARYLDREALAESADELADRLVERARAELLPFAFFVPEREREAAFARARRQFVDTFSSVEMMLELFGPSGRDPKTGETVFRTRPERVGYAGPGRFEVAFGDGSGPQITLVFGRRWLFFWKVVAIRFPDEFYRELLR